MRAAPALLQEQDALYFFAEDATFDIPQLQNDLIAGICADRSAARTTATRIRALTQAQPTVYLPSHDPDAGRRLVAGETIQPKI